MRLGSLCSGFGGLDLGLERAGFDLAWHVEPDAACSTVLDAHWPGVPNHGNIKTTDWSAVEPVDALCGGYPCQPFSHAGRRLGEDDPRHLWPFVLAAVCVLRPRLVLLENVAGHLSLGFGRVLGDLAEVGYDAEWRCVRASDVGAPHRRERVFILASPNAGGAGTGGDAGAAPGAEERQRRHLAQAGNAPLLGDPATPNGAGRGCEGGPEPDGREVEPGLEAPRRGDANRRRSAPPDADGPGPQGGQLAGGRHLPTGSGTALAYADGGRRQQRDEGQRRVPVAGSGSTVAWGDYEPAIRRWERVSGERAPDPLDERGRLNVDLTRWMMGFPAGWHGDLGRTAALRGYGNAVQVQVAEHVGRWALS